MTGCLQGWLLIMSVWFEIRDKKQRAQDLNGEVVAEGDGSIVNERTRLVRSET